MIEKIISGGQTGADIAGLKAAKALGIPTGGFMPKNCKTLEGLHREYIELYDVVTLNSSSYVPRTEMNVKCSDVTVRFAFDWGSRGEKCTERFLRLYGKPFLDISIRDIPDEVGFINQVAKFRTFMFRHSPSIVNIAGNSERTYPGIEKLVYDFLLNALV